MNAIEPFIASAVALVVIVTAAVTVPMPRPKPEPPITSQQAPVEKALADCAKRPDEMCFVQFEPLPPKTDVQRVQDVSQDLVEIKAKQKSLAARVKQATKAEREKK